MVAGLTVGIVVVPQGSKSPEAEILSFRTKLTGTIVAYAQLANLPPEYGLYASFLGQLTYWLTGTSKDISVGPVAVVSTLVGSILSKADLNAFAAPISLPDLAASMCFVSGIVVMLMGFLKLGWLVEFIPIPATTAFVTGSAIDISARQLPSLLGITLSTTEERRPTYGVLVSVAQAVLSGDAFNADTVVGIFALAQLYGMKMGFAYLSQRWEKGRTLCFFLATLRAVVTLLVWTSTSYLLNRTAKPGDEWMNVLGAVPSGFPTPAVPRFGLDIMRFYGKQLPAVIIVLLVEHLAIANSFARLNRYTVKANSELLSIGFTNTLSSFLHSYPITGSFSRTAIAAKSGARTPLNGIFGSLVVVLAILFASAFYYIPTAAMSAVIIHAVADLAIEGVHTAMTEFQPQEVAIWALGVFVAFVWDVETAIYVSTGILLILFLRRQSLAHEVRVKIISPRSVSSTLKVEVRGRLEYPNAAKTMAKARGELERFARRHGGVQVAEIWVEGDDEDWDVGVKRAVRDSVREMEEEGWEVRVCTFGGEVDRELGEVRNGHEE